MSLDLPTKTLILETIEKHEYIVFAIVFGSLAQGSGRNESDLDLAVMTEGRKALSADQRMRIIEDLAVALGRPVDLVDLRTVGEPLLGEILRRGVRILGSDFEYGELIKRHVFNQADFVPYRNRILKERRLAWINN